VKSWDTGAMPRVKGKQTVEAGAGAGDVGSDSQSCQIKKSKAILARGGGGQKGCETSRLPHLLTISSQIVARLSALRADRSLLPWIFLVLIYVTSWVGPRAKVHLLEGLDILKHPITWAIEPATLRIVQMYNSASTNYATACLKIP
jgi:hypothetical protein